MAYYNIEPFGEFPAYLRTGIVAATIANVNRGKRGKSFKPADFMPGDVVGKKPRQTADELKQMVHTLFAGFEASGQGVRKKRIPDG